MADEIRIIEYKENQFTEKEDCVVDEHQLAIHLNGTPYISLMCLPRDLDELTIGFLFSEGIIRSFQDIVSIDSDLQTDVFVVLRDAPHTQTKEKTVRVVPTGFANRSLILPQVDDGTVPAITSGLQISADSILSMIAEFNHQSELFQQTGAVHSCKLVLEDGASLFFEDVGRHNALDKIVGRALMLDLSIEHGILLTSGRISSEMLIKTAGLGIPCIVSISAPTRMAVEMARKLNLTLIGFARGSRFNLYSGEHRILP